MSTLPSQPLSGGPAPGGEGARGTFDRAVVQLRRRLIQEATMAVGMLEGALDALWRLDHAAARDVRRRDDAIDREEVEIETECFRLLTLQQPFAKDFRMIAFVLKVNGDIERVADHASSIAKIAMRITPPTPPKWPTALRELGERVPAMCHALMRSVLDEDARAAPGVLASDQTIDDLERRLFDETVEMMSKDPTTLREGLLIYRVGRELERIGDLMKNIAEDLIYLTTGMIVRHEKKKQRQGP